MEFKGTRGKWEVRPTRAKNADGTPLFHDIIIDSNHFISTFRSEGLGIDSFKDKANAQLISKAPEMLEMLIKITNQIDNEHVSDWLLELQDNAKELIEEATKID